MVFEYYKSQTAKNSLKHPASVPHLVRHPDTSRISSASGLFFLVDNRINIKWRRDNEGKNVDFSNYFAISYICFICKTINNPDGTCELYKKDTDTEPAWIWKYTVTDSWHDRKGNLWVKSTFVTEETGFSGYILSKYSKDGTAWENVWSAADYPAEMSPIAGTHSILYRQ
jgi:hypothetical protein